MCSSLEVIVILNICIFQKQLIEYCLIFYEKIQLKNTVVVIKFWHYMLFYIVAILLIEFCNQKAKWK